MKQIAVVTVSFNSHDATREFLASIKNLKTKDFTLDIIVVDNGSKEIFTLNKPDENVKVIRLDYNTGFTGGFNRGISKALQNGADYVLVINNDTIVDPSMITELLDVSDTHPDAGIVVPKIYFAKGHEYHKDRYKKDELGKVFWYAGGYMDWDNVKSIHRGVDEVDKGQYDVTEKADFATGCCMLIKKEVFGKVGMFDEKFFLYYEDADLCMRIKKSGYYLYYAPKAFLHHLNASSSGGAGNTLQDYFLTRNQLLFGLRYAPAKSKAALLRQSIRFLKEGRPMQKLGVKDFYLRKFGKGTFFEKREG